jgi:hypothetical protein
VNAYIVHFVHRPPRAAFSVKVLADDVLHAREIGERMLARQFTRRARRWWQLDRAARRGELQRRRGAPDPMSRLLRARVPMPCELPEFRQ